MSRLLPETPLFDAASRFARGAANAAARVRAYASESTRLLLDAPTGCSILELLRLFPRWWSSLDAPEVLTDHPWLCLAAIDVLEKILRPEMHVFEYGSGGSTIFFSRRVAHVWSVEHDRGWYEEVRSRIERAGISNCDLRLVDPGKGTGSAGDPSDPTGYASGDARFRGRSFERYVNAIADHADRSLDLVLVDGRARPSCCRAAMPKVKVGGHIVLDNAEVAYYRAALRQFQSSAWALTDVRGPQIGLWHFSETCFWQRLAP